MGRPKKKRPERGEFPPSHVDQDYIIYEHEDAIANSRALKIRRDRRKRKKDLSMDGGCSQQILSWFDHLSHENREDGAAAAQTKRSDLRWYRRPGEGSVPHEPTSSVIRPSSPHRKDDDSTENEPDGATAATVILEEERQKLNALAEELVALKRQLWPTALRCAEKVLASRSRPSDSEDEDEDEDSEIDSLESTAWVVFDRSRKACNPYEFFVGETKYVNRSATKLFHLDVMLDRALLSTAVLTSKKPDDQGKGKSQVEDPFRFVDLCGAPGGFSEYIASRLEDDGRDWNGWGLSLVGSNKDGTGTPWRIDRILPLLAGGKFHISVGRDDTGDVLNWDNVLHLQTEMQETMRRRKSATAVAVDDDWKAHLIVADGGSDSQRNAEDQEATAAPTVVAQVAAALSILRPGGNFVLKYFGSQRSAGTLSAMAFLESRFRGVGVAKPISSRPASAERYLVCRDFLGFGEAWDGKVWRDKIMEEKLSEVDKKCTLESFLNEIDRDVLRLNIKTCQEILSYMQPE